VRRSGGGTDGFLENTRLADDMVAGTDEDNALSGRSALLHQGEQPERDCRSCVLRAGLLHDKVLRNVQKLTRLQERHRAEPDAREYFCPRGIADRKRPPQGALVETALLFNPQELLGELLPGERPKPGSRSACEHKGEYGIHSITSIRRYVILF